MNELLDLLARAVYDGTLTEDEAALLIAAGMRAAITLPLPPQDFITRTGRRGLVTDTALTSAAVTRGLSWARTMSRDGIQARFEREARNLAAQYANTDIERWQRGMGQLVAAHTVAQAANGAGARRLSLAEYARLDAVITVDMAYLSRFADTMAVRVLQGKPFSEAQIVARSDLYAGTGMGEWWRASEARAEGRGWVVDYIAVDDPVTCGACMQAAAGGPYLPQQGPMPGITCFGRGHCRCHRVARYSPQDWLRLTSGAFG